MKTIQLTNAVLSPASGPGGFDVSISMRYGTSGAFTPLGTYHVNQDTTLLAPLTVSVDETINTIIEVKTTYIDCPSSTPYLETFNLI